MGGNIRLGYCENEQDSSPLELAGDRLTDLVAAHLHLGYGQRALDVACGTGRPAARVSAQCEAQIVGITISAHQCTLAHNTHQTDTTQFVLADAISPPPPDASFDAAYAIESLLHMSNKHAALIQISRVLRPKGCLVIADACLRTRPDDHARSVITRTSAQFQFAALLTRQNYQRLLTSPGLSLDQYVDITEHVRRSYKGAQQQTWVAYDGDGSYTVALFNLGGSAANVTAHWSDLGFTGSASVRDLWSHTNLGTFSGSLSASVVSHGSRLLHVVPAADATEIGAPLISALSGRCADSPKGTNHDGVHLEVWDCNGGPNQNVTYNASTKALGLEGKCFDAYDNQTAAGMPVDLYDCNGGANQQWTRNGNGTITGCVPHRNGPTR